MTQGTGIDPIDAAQTEDEEAPEGSIEVAVAAPRSRRALLAGVAAAAGALVAQAATAPLPAGAANGSNAKVGQTNSGSNPTTFQNYRHSSSARALNGTTTWTGLASQSAGVTGESKGENGIGVFGKANNGSDARGVLGRASDGTGVRGTGGTYGVYGDSASNYGVYGAGGPLGVYGTGSTYGVYGGGGTYGVYGSGSSYALYGSGGTYGAVGTGTYGVYGSGTYGVYGSGSSYAVFGSGGTYGVYGSGTYGVVGTGASYGLYGTGSGSAWGLYATSGSSYAAVFGGPVYVSGALTKAGGGFQIDHPLEPERRYLIHSFVEGPERMNVYRGTIKLNARGRATVRLPRYFAAANKNPSYQLTAVGAAAPALHVAKGVEGNRFVVAGGAAGQTVCWQVTATRDDAWARKNPLRVEQLKAKGDRGKYLLPGALGKRASAGILHVARPRAQRTVRKPQAGPKPRLKSA